MKGTIANPGGEGRREKGVEREEGERRREGEKKEGEGRREGGRKEGGREGEREQVTAAYSWVDTHHQKQAFPPSLPSLLPFPPLPTTHPQ